MKFLRFLAVLLLILGLLVLGLFISGNQYLIKGAWATYLHGETSATIDDMRFFDTRTIQATNPKNWDKSSSFNEKELSGELREVLEKTRSVAFVVVKNGELAHEEYWDGYSDTSLSNSFSMAKSITTLLTQIAIQEGFITSWDDEVSKYLPELEGAYRNELKLIHLSTMTAGLQWDENYHNPFDITAKAYYGPDIERLMLNEVPVVNPPGEVWEYQSGAPQLLGLVLERALETSISKFAAEKLWFMLQAERDAQWHLDHKDGTELTYCCFNSNARDFARLGQMMLNHGKWKGHTVVDSAFIAQATQGYAVNHYGYSFWIDTDDHLTPVYYMRGILGQYIIVIPEKNLVIVRLGRERLEKKDEHSLDFHIIVDEVMKYF
ncbi:MAG TPA: serine hydrolase [Cryomorphaceae bacterium]|nr:serine hydrolase [Owenweeksia sp.]HBF19411.1 serine hydrolase [Cryomorphaceae bacterium]HCQ16615.1 serine hydrolase [Cryomorphaceae bacterium]|tara:strand:+ start:303 stop:1436 length:1134 start_codon:yes stop_codon:yes gene_type:complete